MKTTANSVVRVGSGLLLGAAVIVLATCRQADVVPAVEGAPLLTESLTASFTAVFLTNGQTYFGRIENPESAYPVLTSVYYVQTQVNPQTKEVKNTLVKRGSEWHAPERMVLNAQHILFMEPVTPESTVAKLIDELTNRKP